MAAKQGLTAHLSQAGEDAKRAVLSRTSYGASSWFSNLNTVCTIKSAPPKTPAVLELLATKSGWLYKRNEQHVWQARWCCIVPHMFLYYFDATAVGGSHEGGGGGAGGDAGPSGGGGIALPLGGVPTPQQQEDWNNSLQRNGFKNHEKRGFSLFNENPASASQPNAATASASSDAYGDGTAPNITAATQHTPPPSSSKYQQPAGIIDLECYTALHRSHVGGSTVLELAGDDAVNPDLRAFYFCVDSNASDDWTDAMLNGRHAALVDEVEAYQQVADGFASQLQTLHAECDDLRVSNETLKEELYHVRCAHEETRRKCYGTTMDALENVNHLVNNDAADHGSGNLHLIHSLRSRAKDSLAADSSIPVCLNVLQNYVCSLEDSLQHLHQENSKLKQQITRTGESDQQRVQDLQLELEDTQERSQAHVAELQAALDASLLAHEQTKKELLDTQKELTSTKLEFTMLSTQHKNKVQTLHSHKRILKKEVVQLRQIVEDCKSELQALQHAHESNRASSSQHEQRAELLERYVAQIETQLKRQQNMMEIMSMSAAGGGGSVFGGGGGSAYGGGSVYGEFDPAVSSTDRDVVPSQPTGVVVAQRHMHHSTGNPHHRQAMSSSSLPPLKTPRNIPPMSPRVVAFKHPAPEAAEPDLDDEGDNDDQYNSDDRDRTAPHGHHSATVDLLPTSFRRGSSFRDMTDADNKSHMSELTEDRTQRVLEGAWVASPRQFHSHHHHHQSPHHSTPNHTASPPPVYVEKKGQPKLSVAQRSRIEADRQTTPVRVRLDSIIAATDKATPSLKKREESSASSSKNGGVWQRMEDAVLGPADRTTLGRRKSNEERLKRGQTSAARGDESESSSQGGGVGSGDDDDSVSESDSSSCSASNSEEEKKKDSASNTPDAGSKGPGATSTANLTLAQRSQLQRAMQVQFLKEQGLISNENDVKGGASISATNTPSPAFRRLGSGSSSQRKKGPIRLNSGLSDGSSHCASSVGR